MSRGWQRTCKLLGLTGAKGAQVQASLPVSASPRSAFPSLNNPPPLSLPYTLPPSLSPCPSRSLPLQLTRSADEPRRRRRARQPHPEAGGAAQPHQAVHVGVAGSQCAEAVHQQPGEEGRELGRRREEEGVALSTREETWSQAQRVAQQVAASGGMAVHANPNLTETKKGV